MIPLTLSPLALAWWVWLLIGLAVLLLLAGASFAVYRFVIVGRKGALSVDSAAMQDKGYRKF